MARLVKIKLSESDELKIIQRIRRMHSIPKTKSHQNLKAYNRKKKFKKDLC